MLQAVMNLSQLAESDARREEAHLRVRHHAALIAAIVCRTGKVGLVSVHLCDSGHHASPTSPRLMRCMTLGVGQRSVGQRSGNSSALNHCVHCGFHAGWCFAVGPRSMGKLRFAFSSVAEGRRCSACSTYLVRAMRLSLLTRSFYARDRPPYL